MDQLPAHLKKYIVEQNYEKYSALDHAVWRYVLRQLKDFLARHAHESYLSGLEATGIDIEQIPRIENISQHLKKFGWQALPVSGFIPPAAFMELQSLSILPIASDMRTLDHLLYTPAPDIVHEAAGHAPIIANMEYSDYLKQYAQVAKKAIISKEDIELYKAIRELSDIKEHPGSTPKDITAAELRLTQVSKSMSFVSEASQLSRMNWWTAEYGLIGSLQEPRIFGAGLLSSLGESQECLSGKVKKIALSLDCIKQTYDITEPQPQLFVARDFKHLAAVLNELAETMSYRIGGIKALERAKQAESVNTVEFENGLQISGVLKKYHAVTTTTVAYLQFEGPTQLCFKGKEIEGHSKSYHSAGYGTPLGKIENFNRDGLKINSKMELNYASGVNVVGTLAKISIIGSKATILTFENATSTFKNETLFLPEWGLYDVILAEDVKSVFGGPADRIAYGEIDDFVAARVVVPKPTTEQKKLFSLYQEVRNLRNTSTAEPGKIAKLFAHFKENAPNEWLLFVELSELATKHHSEYGEIESHLKLIAQSKPQFKNLISQGLRLAHAKH